VTLNKVIAGAPYIVICGWNAVKVQGWQLTVEWRSKQRCLLNADGNTAATACLWQQLADCSMRMMLLRETNGLPELM